MAAPRSRSKLSRQWVRHTRRHFLKFLRATQFPLLERHGLRGQTFVSPEWLVMLIGVLAVKCREPTYLGIHRMTCRFWKDLGGRQLSGPPVSESQLRERFKKIGYQLGTALSGCAKVLDQAYIQGKKGGIHHVAGLIFLSPCPQTPHDTRS